MDRVNAGPVQGAEGPPQAPPQGTAVPFDTGGKVLKAPDTFSPNTIEEEVSQWGDWAFAFRNFLSFMDWGYLTDLKMAEQRTAPIDSTDYNGDFFEGREDRKVRGMKLYSVLSSYLRNRPLKVLRAVDDMNGFEVWRRLTAELEPSSRSRSLAMAQALVGFPSMSKGASLMDYILTYEKLVNEYERLSGVQYDCNLKLGTLLKGIPLQLRQHVMVDINDRTTYQELRSKLLQYERSNQTWSAENILGSLSVQSHHSSSSSKEYQGPIPMEVDRMHDDRRRDPKGKGDPKGRGKGKGDYKGKGKGYGGYGRG